MYDYRSCDKKAATPSYFVIDDFIISYDDDDVGDV